MFSVALLASLLWLSEPEAISAPRMPELPSAAARNLACFTRCQGAFGHQYVFRGKEPTMYSNHIAFKTILPQEEHGNTEVVVQARQRTCWN